MEQFNLIKQKNKAALLTFISVIICVASSLGAITSTTTGGNWNATGTWVGGVVPSTTDDVIIGNGATITVNVNATCNSVKAPAGANGTLSVNTGIILTVTTSVTLPGSAAAAAAFTISGAGTINCASFTICDNTAPSASSISLFTVNTTITSLNITGNLNLYGAFKSSGSKKNNPVLDIQSGTVTVGGSVITTNEDAANVSLIKITAASPTLATFKLTGTGASPAPFSLSATGTNTLTLNSTSATVEYGGAGSQSIYATAYTNITTSGSGTKTLAGNSTAGGVLTVSNNTTLALSTFTLGSPTSVVLECDGSTSGGTITGTGALTLGGNITVNDNGASTNGASIGCPVSLGATRTFIVNNGSSTADLTISSVVSGSTYGITKDSIGKMVLSGANDYTGAVAINAGILNIQHATGLGTTAGGATVTSGAVLEFQGGISVGTETINLNGTGISTGGALRNISGDNSCSGSIVLQTASRINSDLNTLTLTGGITGSGLGFSVGGAGNVTVSTSGINTSTSGTLIKDGNGILTISASSDYTGATTISAGTLALGAANVINNASAFTLNGGTFSTGASTGNAETIGTLALTENSTLSLGTGSHTLTIASSSGVGWTASKVLTINGWTGSWNGTTGTAGIIVITSSGITEIQRKQIRFNNAGTYYRAKMISGDEMVPDIDFITTGSVSGSPFCAGTSGISVGFTYELASNFGSATFKAQLSNASGSFGTPVDLQTVASDLSGSQSISVTIPGGTADGSGYRIRVVSNTPVVNGSNNGTDLSITSALPTVDAGAALSSICQAGTTVALGGSSTGAATTIWDDGTATGTFTNNAGSTPGTATYTANASLETPVTLTLTATNGCGNITDNKSLTVNPTIGTPVFTLGASSNRCFAAGSVTYGATSSNTTGITYTIDATCDVLNDINTTTGEITYNASWLGTCTITATAAGCNGPKTANHNATTFNTVSSPAFNNVHN